MFDLMEAVSRKSPLFSPHTTSFCQVIPNRSSCWVLSVTTNKRSALLCRHRRNTTKNHVTNQRSDFLYQQRRNTTKNKRKNNHPNQTFFILKNTNLLIPFVTKIKRWVFLYKKINRNSWNPSTSKTTYDEKERSPLNEYSLNYQIV